MESLFVSAGLVAIAEIGDKTQLLALVLAARYRRPIPIVFGILIATLVNHAIAAWAGASVSAWLDPDVLRWILGLGFIAMAIWCLVPDKADGAPITADNAGVFIATTIAFFLVEIGDKTQIATVALAAQFNDVVRVTLGTTLGMMLVNVPVVMFGEVIAKKAPMKIVRMIAAGAFVVLGILALAGAEFDLFG